MVDLTELQRDAITELLNIGMGRAVAALSQMVAEEVHLEVPFVNVLSRLEASNELRAQSLDRIAAVKQQFDGPFSGDALLLFPKEKSLELVRSLMNDTVPLESLTDLEQEALMEVGNVILNACLGSIANLLNNEINSGLPVYLQGTCDELLGVEASPDAEGSVVLFLRVNFLLQKRDIRGYVAFLMDVKSIKTFKESVTHYLSYI